MVMFKRELASNDKIRVNNRGCSLYRVSPIELRPSFSLIVYFPLINSSDFILEFSTLLSDIYIQSTLNIDRILRHMQLIVCAVKC